jgi:hypothetical protein
MILTGLRKDAAAAIDKIIGTYKTAPDMELRTSCAVLSERLLLIRALTRARKNKKFAQEELDALLSTVDEDDG